MVAAGDLTRALEHQVIHGGRLGQCLVTIGAIEEKELEAFLHRLPPEPRTLADTGIDETELMGIMMKLIYAGRLESGRQIAEAVKLPFQLVSDLIQMAVDRKLLRTLGTRDTGSLTDLSYTLTDEGKRWTLEAIGRVGYMGPAPVTLSDFTYQVNLHKVTNEVVTFDRIRKATEGLTFEDSLIEQCGPALNSGRAMLLYGPPGNGKTSVARAMSGVFNDVIYVPYAIFVEGQMIRMYDPSIHEAIDSAGTEEDNPLSIVRREVFDARYVPCKRPFVIAGGELTLDMLDLRYDATAHFYEAPLHVKALCGTFVIDDFGRQLVSPSHLLNRWIVPLENKVDFLKLHTGKTFTVPFEELIIFSTNLEPEDLMDTAFLRRLPYKIEVGAPTLESYHTIFSAECARQGFEISREAFDAIVYKLTNEKGLELACYQPRFIVDQVMASCRFMQIPSRFEPRFISNALDNLRVNRHSKTAAQAV
jgi:energy-coupling factor transporter ATP-binding protein EcfA2